MIGWVSPAGVFGKAPWHADFLRPSPLTSDLHRFDEWLFSNASVCSEPQHGPHAQPVSSYGFLLQLESSRPSRAIAGVLRPSRDGAGRAYPLAVAAPLDFGSDLASTAEVAPIILEEYWDAAVDLLGVLGEADRDVRDRGLTRLTERPLASGDAARNLYREWAARTNASLFCEWLDWPVSRLRAAIRSMSTGPAAPARTEPFALVARETIRVPLGQAAGAALCFWLDAIRRATRERKALTSFFWAYDGERGDALVFLDSPAEAVLSTLWRTSHGRHPRSRVLDLTTTDDSAHPSAEADVGDDDPTILAFLDQVARHWFASA